MSQASSSGGTPNRWAWFSYENGILLILGFCFGLIFFDRNALTFYRHLLLSETDK